MKHKVSINQKINAKGNCILLYYYFDDRLMRIIKSGYRNIEMYSPTILIPIQFTEHKIH
jgi:hypothetical protein